MRLSLALAALVVASVPCIAHAEPAAERVQPLDEARLARARQVVDQAFPPENREAIFLGAQDAVVSQMRSVQLARFANEPGAKAVLDGALDAYLVKVKVLSRAHIPDLIEAIAHAYAREFSSDELEVMSAFFASPAGKHYMSRSVAVLTDPDVAAANRRLFEAAQPLLTEMREKLTHDLAAYYAQHPPKASKGT